MKPIVFTAVSLESKYGGTDEPWLASTYLSSTIGPEYVEELREISKPENISNKILDLRKTPSPFSKNGTWEKLLIAIIAQPQRRDLRNAVFELGRRLSHLKFTP
jgi:hypothetical protein